MNKEFLGSGWKFPIGLNDDGSFELAIEDEDIKESILIILNTSPGERVMRPEFGCGIHNHVFSVINNSNLKLIEEEVEKALILFEPRITIENLLVTVDGNEGSRLLINIEYSVKSSNSRHNLVYPFYLTERG